MLATCFCHSSCAARRRASSSSISCSSTRARFETDSSKHVEDVVAALKGHKCFREIKQGKLEKNKDGSKVQFRLDIQVECPSEGST